MFDKIKAKAAAAWAWYRGRLAHPKKRMPTILGTIFVLIVLIGIASMLGCACNPSNEPEAPSCDGGSCSV